MPLARRGPFALPRWSVTIVEPHIADLLEQYSLTREDFAVPDAIETRLARAAWPDRAVRAVAAFRSTLDSCGAELRAVLEADGLPLPPQSVDAVTRTVEWRLSRFERRITAAVKRRETGMMRDLATIRGALYPAGLRQERALNIIPLLARNGTGLFGRMREAARLHARGLVGQAFETSTR